MIIKILFISLIHCCWCTWEFLNILLEILSFIHLRWDVSTDVALFLLVFTCQVVFVKLVLTIYILLFILSRRILRQMNAIKNTILLKSYLSINFDFILISILTNIWYFSCALYWFKVIWQLYHLIIIVLRYNLAYHLNVYLFIKNSASWFYSLLWYSSIHSLK